MIWYDSFLKVFFCSLHCHCFFCVPPLFYPVCFVLAPGYLIRDFPQMSGDPWMCPFIFRVRLLKSWLSEWMEVADIEFHCRMNRSRPGHFTVELLNVTHLWGLFLELLQFLQKILQTHALGYPFGIWQPAFWEGHFCPQFGSISRRPIRMMPCCEGWSWIPKRECEFLDIHC